MKSLPFHPLFIYLKPEKVLLLSGAEAFMGYRRVKNSNVVFILHFLSLLFYLLHL